MGAGLFVFTGLLGAVGLLGAFRVSAAAPPLLIAFVLVLVMVGLIAAAMVLFSPGKPLGGAPSVEQLAQELEAQDLLTSKQFSVTRAFEVEEFEDEGLHYYLELSDGRVLFMTGQYLYDYEPIDETGDGGPDPRRFPCTDFVVRRHRAEGYVVDIQCGGHILEPEVTAPPFGEDVWREGGIPPDGAILMNASYDEIKRLRIGPLRVP
jgi:hypothetical protein